MDASQHSSNLEKNELNDFYTGAPLEMGGGGNGLLAPPGLQKVCFGNYLGVFGFPTLSPGKPEKDFPFGKIRAIAHGIVLRLHR